MAERTCAQCGTAIQHEGRGRPKRWCGDRCRLAWQRAERAKGGRKSEFDRTCRTCGDPMRRGTGTLPQGEAECRRCRRSRSEAMPPKHQPKPVPESTQCGQCGTAFAPSRWNQIYCSIQCRNSRAGRGVQWQRKAASPTERGYGAEHQRERKKWRAIVDRGEAYCCLCGVWLEPGAEFDLDHTPDRTGYRGAACPSCNRSDGAKRSGGWSGWNSRRPTMTKTCKVCSRDFDTVYPKQQYCSPECRPRGRKRSRPRPPKPERRCECGEQITQGKRCPQCRDLHARAYARQYMRNRYRKSVGIDLDAPLYGRA